VERKSFMVDSRVVRFQGRSVYRFAIAEDDRLEYKTSLTSRDEIAGVIVSFRDSINLTKPITMVAVVAEARSE